MQLLLRWAISAGALYATIWILSLFGQAKPGEGPWYSWFIAGVIMGLVNALIRPVARFLTAPLNCMTFGIVGVLVNALMFWLVPVIMEAIGIPVFENLTLLGAVVGAMLVGGIGAVANKLVIREADKDER